ncbi:EAL domain-containing protein [Rhodoferax sp. AJA081-3]|uniref:putative bifunctional diguanylate cyclase/phosphodiesterase n=1 Tax=Rhodoferax sp. AJA081-3 TaxID=2752316 RepID=UPI001ADF3A96|nr:EAL domain-containing protein [Rhodoferax sp. AJA081-3]QTN26571.1 EAL domain-containing protein [Rhodoferax sp. AJA081-3]
MTETRGWQAWWPRRIGWRLALGFGVLVALMLVALAQAIFQIHNITGVTQRFATGDMQRLLRVQALSLQTEGVGNALIRLINAPLESRVKEYADVDERNRRIDGIVESLASDMHDDDQAQNLQRLVQWRAAYAEAFIATADEIEAGNRDGALHLLDERVNPALKSMLVESNALLSRERQRIETRLEDAQMLFDRVALWVAGLSVLAVVLAVWLGVRTTRSVVGPLATLERAAKRITNGDYTSPVPTTRTQEVDRVGQALNTMTEAVAQRERDIVHLAFHDPLTGLPNRTALLKPAADAGAAPNCLALMDLARLKAINETLGYTTGDTLIVQTAERASLALQQAAADGLIGPSPVVARLSGGTFAAAFCAPHRAAVEALRERIEMAMGAPVHCSGHSVDLSLNYGLADSGDLSQAGAKALPVDTLLRNAEVALHSAKRAAMGFAWHSAAQEAARLGHLSLLSDLRQAVATSQLQMWLQPKFSLLTGHAVGTEALVRWQHPTRGFVSPAEFVPFAEQAGYITMVTNWMLEQALRTLAAWAPTHPELSIAVNVSTRDLQHKGFAERVARMVEASGVPAKRLRLEITESGLMDDPTHSVALLHTLREIGTPLSIDDFGTGYSSLAYLQKLPVSELKIDRSFIDKLDQSPGTQKLVRAMTEMGHGLDLMVTAEGVETEAERETITRLGVDVMQGYLASRPLYGEKLQAWFDALPAHTG